MTLRRHLAERATILVAFLAAAAVSAGIALAVYHPEPVQTEHVDFGPTHTDRLIDKHDCWVGAEPADVDVPRGVIVRFDGETAARYRGAKATDKALAFVFNDADNGVAQVFAFCRGGAR